MILCVVEGKKSVLKNRKQFVDAVMREGAREAAERVASRVGQSIIGRDRKHSKTKSKASLKEFSNWKAAAWLQELLGYSHRSDYLKSISI